MLKRVLTLCAGILISCHAGLFGQEDLSGAIKKIQYEQYNEAEEELNSILAKDPKNIEDVYYWLGIISYRNEAFAKAKSYFEMGLEEKGKSALNLAGMGMSFIKENKLSEAYDFLNRAIAISKGKDIEAEFAIAYAFLEGGSAENAEARKILYTLKDKVPEDPRANIALAEYYKKTSVPELAIEEYEKAKQKDPNYVQAYAALAELYYEEGKKSNDGNILQEGLKNANKAVELDANYPPSYRIRGELYLIAKQYERARDDLQKYVSLTAEDLKARIRYASFLFLSENYDEAVKEIEKIEIDTTTNVMRRLKAMAYNQLGENQKAKAAIDDYFANVKKEEYIIWQDYQVAGDIYRSMGDLEKADENYDKMILKNSDMASYFDDLSEEYADAAKAVDKEADNMQAAAKAAQVDAQKYYQEYNDCAARNDADCANAAKAKMDEAVEKGKEMIAQREEKLKEQIPFYILEAHYRQKVVDYQPAESLQNYYKLARAHYNAEQYAEAEPYFWKTLEMKEDYTVPYNYLMQIANKQENVDTTSMEWFVKKPSEKAAEVFGAKSELDKSEQRLLLVAYEILANYHFNPTGEDGNYHCEDAKPYVDKIYAIEPGYSRIKSLAEYCDQTNR